MIKQKAKKKCIKGFQCGYTCIKRGKVCRKNASPAVEGVITGYIEANKKLEGLAPDEIAKPAVKQRAARKPKKPVAFVNADTKLEDITKGELIGSGVFGDVYMTPNGTVAKVIEKGFDGTEAKMLELLGEAGHAPKLLYSGSNDGVGIIEMEFLKGYKPAYSVNNGFLTKEQAAKIQEGISFMHKAGLTHNDLHKANVMVNVKTNDAKLIDFGIASEIRFLGAILEDLQDAESFGYDWPTKTPQRRLLERYYSGGEDFDEYEMLETYLAELNK